MQDQRIMVECATCGEELLKSPSVVKRNKSGHFYCCPEHAGRNGGGHPRRYQERPCEQCRKLFYPMSNKKTARFCSRRCKDNWWARFHVVATCEVCGKDFRMRPSEAERNSGRFCSRACSASASYIHGLGRFHNGREVTTNGSGYALIYEPDHPKASRTGRVSEHRWVVEQRLGRPLSTEEQVHHVNGNKVDNRPENLVVLDAESHTLITVDERGLRRRAAQLRIRELETQLVRAKAKLARYRKRFGPLT